MNNTLEHMFDDSKLDERTIQMYEQRIRNDEPVPAVVLREDEAGGLEVIDGLHRLAAMERCGITHMSGTYLVNCPPEDVPVLRRALNRREDN